MSRLITLEVSSCRRCPLRQRYDNTRSVMCSHPAAPKSWSANIPLGDDPEKDPTPFPAFCPGKEQP